MLSQSVLEVSVPPPPTSNKSKKPEETPRFSLDDHQPRSSESRRLETDSSREIPEHRPERFEDHQETAQDSNDWETLEVPASNDFATSQTDQFTPSLSEQNTVAAPAWYAHLTQTPNTGSLTVETPQIPVQSGQSDSIDLALASDKLTASIVPPHSEQTVSITPAAPVIQASDTPASIEQSLIPLVEALGQIPTPQTSTPTADLTQVSIPVIDVPKPVIQMAPVSNEEDSATLDPVAFQPTRPSIADVPTRFDKETRIQKAPPVLVENRASIVPAPAQPKPILLPPAPETGGTAPLRAEAKSDVVTPSFDLSASLSSAVGEAPKAASKPEISSSLVSLDKVSTRLDSARIAAARKWLSTPQRQANPTDLRQSEPVLPPRSEATTSLEEHSKAAASQQALRGRIAVPDTVLQIRTQIVERFEGKAQRFEMRLDPPELGKIDVRIEIGADKKMYAVLATREPAALAELMRGARALEQSLRESGLDVGGDSLTFRLDRGGADQQDRSGQGEDASSQSGPRFSGSELEGEAESSQDNVESFPQRIDTPHISSFRRMRLDISA